MGKQKTTQAASDSQVQPTALESFIGTLEGPAAESQTIRLQWVAENKPEALDEILAETGLSSDDLDHLLDAAGAPNPSSEEVAGDDAGSSSTDGGEEVVIDEPEAPAVETPAPAATIPSPVDVVGKDDAVLQQPPAEIPPAKKSIVLTRLASTLDTYVTEMATSKPHNAKEGADIQRVLYRAIEGVVYAKDNGDFVTGMNLLLDVIDKNSTGVFSERYAFRFWEELSLPRTQRQEFEHLMRLFIDIGPQTTRKTTVTPVRLENAMHYVQNHEIKERLTEYVKRLTA